MNDYAESPPPPQDVAAERAVLGSMLLSVDAIGAAIDLVSGPDFYRPQHETIYDAIVALYDQGKPADAITVAAALGLSGDLAKVGGGPYLHTLLEATPSAAAVSHYAGIVADKAATRRGMEVAAETIAKGRSGAVAGVDLCEQAAAKMDAAAKTPRSTPPLSEVYASILDDAQGLGERAAPGWKYGLGYDLDRGLSRMTPGKLVIVGARPGIGKSVIGAMIARSVAWQQGGRAVLASMEMSAKEVFTRILASHCVVALDKFDPDRPADEMTAGDLDKLAEAYKLAESDALTIEDSEDVGLSDLRSMVRHHRPHVLVVDYLQLMRTPKAESRQQAVSEIARGLKLLAKREGITVVALSQLNRESPHRRDSRPTLTDLRESGELEQAADTVLLLHRPDMTDPEAPPGESHVIVAKQRSGQAGFSVTMGAQMHYARFVDFARE